MTNTFKNQVEFSVDDAKMIASMKKQREQAEGLESSYGKVGKSVGVMAGQIVKSATVAGAAVLGLATVVVKMGLDFESELQFAINKTNEFGAEFKKTIRDDIIKTSNDFGRSSKDFVASTKTMFENGFTATEQIKKMNTEIASLSVVSGKGSEVVATMSGIVVGLTNSFNLDPIKDTHQLVADLFALFGPNGGFDARSFAGQIGVVDERARGANQSLETLLQISGLLISSGTKPEFAFAGLSEAFNTVQRTASNQFDSFLRDSTGKIRDFRSLGKDLFDIPFGFGPKGSKEFERGLIVQQKAIESMFTGPGRAAIKSFVLNYEGLNDTIIGTTDSVSLFDKRVREQLASPPDLFSQVITRLKNIATEIGLGILDTGTITTSLGEIETVIDKFGTIVKENGTEVMLGFATAIDLVGDGLRGLKQTGTFFANILKGQILFEAAANSDPELIAALEAAAEQERFLKERSEAIEKQSREKEKQSKDSKEQVKVDEVNTKKQLEADKEQIKNGKEKAEIFRQIEEKKGKAAAAAGKEEQAAAAEEEKKQEALTARQELAIGITSRAVDSLGDAFANMFKDTETGFKEMLDGFKNSLLDLVGNLLARKLFEKLLGPLFLTTAKIAPTSWIGRLFSIGPAPVTPIPPAPSVPPGSTAPPVTLAPPHLSLPPAPVRTSVSSASVVPGLVKGLQTGLGSGGLKAPGTSASSSHLAFSPQTLRNNVKMGLKGISSGAAIPTVPVGASGANKSGVSLINKLFGISKSVPPILAVLPEGRSTASSDSGLDALTSVSKHDPISTMDTTKALGLDATFKRFNTNILIRIQEAIESMDSGGGGFSLGSLGGIGKSIGGSLGPLADIGKISGIGDLLTNDIFKMIMPFVMNSLIPGSGLAASLGLNSISGFAEGGIFRDSSIIRVGEGHGKRKTEVVAPVDDLPGLLNLDTRKQQTNPVVMEQLIKALSSRGISIQGGVHLNVKDVSDISSLEAELERVSAENFTLN